MITIRITPSRSIFGGRKQWKFGIIGGNNRRVSDRDTYANPGDIASIMRNLCHPNGDSVELEIHHTDGTVTRERIR